MNDDNRLWRKSRYSQPQQSCVELSVAETQTGIQDTKNRGGGAIHVSAAAFAQFLAIVKLTPTD